MALREGTRRWLIRGAWAVLLVASSMLVGLRVGRPVFYTDGTREVAGSDLAASGMLAWRAPEVVAELPGPVAGRVAELGDGRLLYGRLGADGTADLVVWDPVRPTLPPEPVFGLNSPANDLAPQVLADGRILFASDRDGGAGGYDLYVAPRLLATSSEVQPIPATRTALDETDPALAPDGIDLVFVRSDRLRDGGNDGVLWRWRFGDELDPVPLFGPTSRNARPIDRDPAFAADGASLWFVRKLPGAPLRVLRASRCNGVFDAPLPIELAPGRELRSPLPRSDGRSLGLLSPKVGADGVDLWYAGTAQEVVPWWPGQRWLELVLLGLVATSLLLVLLLHFGRRWSTLDLVAQCLLFSLLLHVLLFLWLMGVEITGSLLPGDEAGGGFEVSVVDAGTMAASAGGGGGGDLAAEVRFEARDRELGAEAPAAESLPAAAVAAAVAAGSGEWERSAEAKPVEVAAELAEAAHDLARRDGADAASGAIAATTLPAVDTSAAAAAQTPRAARVAAAGTERVVVAAPGSGVARAMPASADLAGSASGLPLVTLGAAAAAPTPADPALHDAAANGAANVAGGNRAGSDAAAAAPTLATAGVATAVPRTSDVRSTKGAATAVPGQDAVLSVMPSTSLARRGGAALAAPAANVGAAVATRPSTAAAPAGAPALRDAAAPVAAATAAKAGADAAVGGSALQPLAINNSAATTNSAPVASRSNAASGNVAPTTALPRPGSALARARPTPIDAAGSGPLVATAPTAGQAAAIAPMRTADVAGPAPVGRAAARGSDAPSPAPGLVAGGLAIAGPQVNAMPRVQRDGTTAGLPPREFAVAPPRSSLPRAAADTSRDVPAAVPEGLAGTAYSNRFGPQKAKAIEQFGGSVDTERAVKNGLRYLASIQNRDGSWGDRADFDGKYGFVYVGKSALCVLAFLGAGHTPLSQTEHSGVVQKAIDHLLALQEDDSGAFGPSSCYGHGIATYAIAECYGITKDPKYLRPLERALTWILDNQGPRRDRRNRGGWGYFSPGLQAEDDYARVSVTSWMVMALESARLSGVELPTEVLPAAREYLELAWDQPNGWFRYNHKPSRLNSGWPTLPASTPAGAFCLQLLGVPKADPKVALAVDYTVQRRPEEYRRYDDDAFVLQGQGNVYFWYYGTLCCFLHGGDAWTQWNERLRTVLPAAQAQDGSFPPIDVYAQEAGDNRRDRSYTTAMCVLCLEVYYRYFTPLLVGR
jgi:hypothetical protein